MQQLGKDADHPALSQRRSSRCRAAPFPAEAAARRALRPAQLILRLSISRAFQCHSAIMGSMTSSPYTRPPTHIHVDRCQSVPCGEGTIRVFTSMVNAQVNALILIVLRHMPVAIHSNFCKCLFCYIVPCAILCLVPFCASVNVLAHLLFYFLFIDCYSLDRTLEIHGAANTKQIQEKPYAIHSFCHAKYLEFRHFFYFGRWRLRHEPHYCHHDGTTFCLTVAVPPRWRSLTVDDEVPPIASGLRWCWLMTNSRKSLTSSSQSGREGAQRPNHTIRKQSYAKQRTRAVASGWWNTASEREHSCFLTFRGAT